MEGHAEVTQNNQEDLVKAIIKVIQDAETVEEIEQATRAWIALQSQLFHGNMTESQFSSLNIRLVSNVEKQINSYLNDIKLDQETILSAIENRLKALDKRKFERDHEEQLFKIMQSHKQKIEQIKLTEKSNPGTFDDAVKSQIERLQYELKEEDARYANDLQKHETANKLKYALFDQLENVLNYSYGVIPEEQRDRLLVVAPDVVESAKRFYSKAKNDEKDILNKINLEKNINISEEKRSVRLPTTSILSTATQTNLIQPANDFLFATIQKNINNIIDKKNEKREIEHLLIFKKNNIKQIEEAAKLLDVQNLIKLAKEVITYESKISAKALPDDGMGIILYRMVVDKLHLSWNNDRLLPQERLNQYLSDISTQLVDLNKLVFDKHAEINDAAAEVLVGLMINQANRDDVTKDFRNTIISQFRENPENQITDKLLSGKHLWNPDDIKYIVELTDKNKQGIMIKKLISAKDPDLPHIRNNIKKLDPADHQKLAEIIFEYCVKNPTTTTGLLRDFKIGEVLYCELLRKLDYKPDIGKLNSYQLPENFKPFPKELDKLHYLIYQYRKNVSPGKTDEIVFMDTFREIANAQLSIIPLQNNEEKEYSGVMKNFYQYNNNFVNQMAESINRESINHPITNDETIDVSNFHDVVNQRMDLLSNYLKNFNKLNNTFNQISPFTTDAERNEFNNIKKEFFQCFKLEPREAAATSAYIKLQAIVVNKMAAIQTRTAIDKVKQLRAIGHGTFKSSGGLKEIIDILQNEDKRIDKRNAVLDILNKRIAAEKTGSRSPIVQDFYINLKDRLVRNPDAKLEFEINDLAEKLLHRNSTLKIFNQMLGKKTKEMMQERIPYFSGKNVTAQTGFDHSVNENRKDQSEISAENLIDMIRKITPNDLATTSIALDVWSNSIKGLDPRKENHKKIIWDSFLDALPEHVKNVFNAMYQIDESIRLEISNSLGGKKSFGIDEILPKWKEFLQEATLNKDDLDKVYSTLVFLNRDIFQFHMENVVDFVGEKMNIVKRVKEYLDKSFKIEEVFEIDPAGKLRNDLESIQADRDKINKAYEAYDKYIDGLKKENESNELKDQTVSHPKDFLKDLPNKVDLIKRQLLELKPLNDKENEIVKLMRQPLERSYEKLKNEVRQSHQTLQQAVSDTKPMLQKPQR